MGSYRSNDLKRVGSIMTVLRSQLARELRILLSSVPYAWRYMNQVDTETRFKPSSKGSHGIGWGMSRQKYRRYWNRTRRR